MGMPATEAHSVCADLRCRVYLRAGRGGCTNPLTADAGFRPAWPRAALGRYAPSSPGAVAGFDISDTGFRPVHVVGATPAAMRCQRTWPCDALRARLRARESSRSILH